MPLLHIATVVYGLSAQIYMYVNTQILQQYALTLPYSLSQSLLSPAYFLTIETVLAGSSDAVEVSALWQYIETCCNLGYNT